ncbi:hypothetical protein RB10046 [Rhodopirellula baltica SH 1]|uniref:Uncharacterized protein n=1 Tax=Rhodopirellula baltica (strain DSM 10527 / NCIMB 13988 / SH1) TaxID=243090 RepID=Q7UKN1_RHOBA|nr:hypothetical protein RB10046 [Rhodopirellula baltica SH 1]
MLGRFFFASPESRRREASEETSYKPSARMSTDGQTGGLSLARTWVVHRTGNVGSEGFKGNHLTIRDSLRVRTSR